MASVAQGRAYPVQGRGSRDGGAWRTVFAQAIDKMLSLRCLGGRLSLPRVPSPPVDTIVPIPVGVEAPGAQVRAPLETNGTDEHDHQASDDHQLYLRMGPARGTPERSPGVQ